MVDIIQNGENTDAVTKLSHCGRMMVSNGSYPAQIPARNFIFSHKLKLTHPLAYTDLVVEQKSQMPQEATGNRVTKFVTFWMLQ